MIGNGATVRKAAIVIVSLISGLTLASCTSLDPCRTLAPPTAVELAAAAGGAEVEREVGSTECELVDGAWARERPRSKGKK